MFTVVLMNGREYEITEQEKDLLLGKTGMLFLPRLQVTLNTSSISVIEPRGLGKQVDRSKQTEGVLMGGQRVIKQFGRWYLADGSRDENGRLEVEPDPEHYPELQLGILPTPQEYAQTFGHLTLPEWRERLCDLDEAPRSLGERNSILGFTPLIREN